MGFSLSERQVYSPNAMWWIHDSWERAGELNKSPAQCTGVLDCKDSPAKHGIMTGDFLKSKPYWLFTKCIDSVS